MQLETYEAEYQRLAQDPDRWMSSAENLLAASDVLWASVSADLNARGMPAASGRGDHADVAKSHHRAALGRPFLQHASVYLMVAGFAVENALKAIRVKQDPASVTKGKPGDVGISKVVQTHDLKGLANAAGITLSASEMDLLERLQAFLVWAGRYPVATMAIGQAAVQVIWESDQREIRALLDRFAEVFQRI